MIIHITKGFQLFLSVHTYLIITIIEIPPLRVKHKKTTFILLKGGRELNHTYYTSGEHHWESNMTIAHHDKHAVLQILGSIYWRCVHAPSCTWSRSQLTVEESGYLDLWYEWLCNCTVIVLTGVCTKACRVQNNTKQGTVMLTMKYQWCFVFMHSRYYNKHVVCSMC